MLTRPASSSTENEYNEITFVLQLRDEYVKQRSETKKESKDHLADILKFDFERLADFIRFEALKKKKLITIDRIKEILSDNG